LIDTEDGNKVVAWAIPTIQILTTFIVDPFGILSDAEVTQNLLSLALGGDGASASMHLLSAFHQSIQQADVNPDHVREENGEGQSRWVITVHSDGRRG
jgi:hypothetical protein